MRLLTTFFTLTSSFSPHTPSHPPAATHNITLTFDHLPPALNLTPLPQPHKHLAFSPTFSLFAPHSPLLTDYITPHDLNCATSAPNALLGSRSTENGPGASFEIANANAMIEEGLEPYFTLRSLQLKPLSAPAPGTRVWVKGIRKGEGKGAVGWEVDFPSGYHLPLRVDMERFSRERWVGLWKVEIGADFGYGALDWEFCLDDLEVGFTERMGREGEVGVADQRVLRDD